MSIARSLFYGAANVLHPRMLWLMLWPMLLAVGFWGVVGLFLWTRLAVRISLWLQQGLDYALAWAHLDFGSAALVAANVLLFLAFVPLVWLTALFILGVFGMGQMVDHVAAVSFPSLERRHGGGLAGSIANGIVTLIGMLLLAVITLPLWVLAPLWPLIPLVIFAWANQRLLRYDALAEHASLDSVSIPVRRNRCRRVAKDRRFPR